LIEYFDIQRSAIPAKIEFNFHYWMLNIFHLLFEIWINLSNKKRELADLMAFMLREKA